MLMEDCPFDYLPGQVFRWTVTGYQYETPSEHPDDLVTCPHCKGSAKIVAWDLLGEIHELAN